MTPRMKLILEYKHFFKNNLPNDRLEIIKNIPKRNLIFEIAGLNYRLKSYKRLKYDVSLETQYKELQYFCPIDKNLLDFYLYVFDKYVTKDNYPIVFNRAANLFALEELVNASGLIEVDDSFQMNKIVVWDNIFRYLLAVNSEIVKIKPIPPQNITLENISASAIALNELMIEDNPISTAYRGMKLLEYFLKDPTYGLELECYFEKVIKIEKERFIYNILSICMANGQMNSDLEFIYKHEKQDAFLDLLSNGSISNSNPITLLRIKKNPLFKDSDNLHVLLDINFLVSKSYNFLLNDFWFDFLKPQINDIGKEKYNYMHYRAVFGLFFENYIEEIIINSFHHLKHPAPLLFDELKINTPDGQIEIADIYIRQNKKVLVGQVKSSSIYDKEKYSGDIDTLYKNDREKFFKDFGVNQTYESIKRILKYSKSFDSGLKSTKRIEFFPLVIVNDKIFQTPLIPNLLHSRFQELLATENFAPHIINPLVVMNVSDLEYLENSLAKKKTTIWDILKSHYKKIEKSLMPPFIHTADRFIEPDAITKRVTEPIISIINKYHEPTTN